LQVEHPEYFPSIDADTTMTEKMYNSALEYRSLMVTKYMESGKFNAYKWYNDSIVRCLDGELRFCSGFDTNDYLNWYQTNDTILANSIFEASSITHTGEIIPIESDPSLGIPGNTYWILHNSASNTSSPKFYYGLYMLPGKKYDIYALMAPEMPTKILVDEDSIMGKSKIKATLYLGNGAKNVSINSEKIEYEYNHEMTLVPLFGDVEGIEPTCDYNNYLYITSQISSSERRRGFTNDIALIGIIAQPREEPEILPSGVEGVSGQRHVVGYYDMQGRRQMQPVRGVNILRFSDGTIRKVTLK